MVYVVRVELIKETVYVRLHRSARVLKLVPNGIKLKADRLYKRLVCGGLILGCVMFSVCVGRLINK